MDFINQEFIVKKSIFSLNCKVKFRCAKDLTGT